MINFSLSNLLKMHEILPIREYKSNKNANFCLRTYKGSNIFGDVK